jgi:hypothetical protein
MTNTDEKPSFHLSHMAELVFASVMGAIAAKLFDIITPLYGLVGPEVLVILDIVTIIILLMFAFFSVFIVYLLDWVQWKLRHRKS